jgi:uncharacterized small protein (DUF1192 family)
MSSLELTMMKRIGELNKEVAALQAKIKRMAMDSLHDINHIADLKSEVERLTAFTTRTIIPNEELQAQVKRLTKAGDAMAEDLKACYRAEGYDPADSETIPKWNAAKEGKQS